MTNEELCIAIQNNVGNKQDHLMELYKQNSGMIEKIIRRYSEAEELDDLRQEAFFGIARAAELWKPDDNGASFITYAMYWIRAVINRYIEECSGVVRIPSYKRGLMLKYHRIVNNYRVRFGRDPSSRELCALIGLSPEQLEGLKADIQAARIRSTSELIGGEGDDITLEDTLAAEGDQISDVIEMIQHEELSSELWSCVADLRPQQAVVIRGQYKDGRTLKECGDVLGVSTERAKQLRNDGIKELRKARYSKRLLPYLSEDVAYMWGLKGNSVTMFERYGSIQERAMIKLEEYSGSSLWHGKEA